MAGIGHSASDQASGGLARRAASGLSGRWALIGALCALGLQGLSGFLFIAAAGYSATFNSDPSAMLKAGGNSASIFQWASVVDLFGYLLVAPLVAYLHHRFRDDPRTTLYTAAGFAYIFAGAIGATIFLVAGPALLREYAQAVGAQRTSIVTVYTTLYQVVIIGLWQTLECLPGGVWLIGAGANLYHAGQRGRAFVAMIAGGAFLAIAAVHLLGY